MLWINLSWTNPWLYLHLRGFRVWPCWVWLSVTGITLFVEELTDGDSNRGVLVWSISEGQNIQIKLLVPRAILSETVAVSSVFMAGIVWMNESPLPAQRKELFPIHDVKMSWTQYSVLKTTWTFVNYSPDPHPKEDRCLPNKENNNKAVRTLIFSKPFWVLSALILGRRFLFKFPW